MYLFLNIIMLDRSPGTTHLALKSRDSFLSQKILQILHVSKTLFSLVVWFSCRTVEMCLRIDQDIFFGINNEIMNVYVQIRINKISFIIKNVILTRVILCLSRRWRQVHRLDYSHTYSTEQNNKSHCFFNRVFYSLLVYSFH